MASVVRSFAKWGMMEVGITATRSGITETQKRAFLELMLELLPTKLRHGDCRGGDEQAHRLVEDVLPVCIHPPTDSKYRAFCKANEIRKTKPYLDRNHDIVDEADVMVGMPGEEQERLRSGTWATIRYARQVGKPLYMVFPNGKTVYDPGRCQCGAVAEEYNLDKRVNCCKDCKKNHR